MTKDHGNAQANKLMRFPQRPGRVLPDRETLRMRELDLRKAGLTTAAAAIRRELDKDQK
nr:hypothetical protein [uncultured Ruegeria sp.]